PRLRGSSTTRRPGFGRWVPACRSTSSGCPRDVTWGSARHRGACPAFVDAIYPMTYPSHYGPGEYGLADPSATPGRTVGRSLRDFRRQMRGGKAKLIPWLEDFTLGGTTTLQKVREQIRAARRWKTAGFLLWNPSGVYTMEALTVR